MLHPWNNIPAASLSKPLVMVMCGGAIVGVHDDPKEAEVAAAVAFNNTQGKTPATLWTLTKVALPAVPKIEFTEVKGAS